MAVLLLNLVFLLAIMWVLITKLRSTNSVETQQYFKAAKALLVLMPLLGITYVITVYAPTPDIQSKNVFEYTRAVLLSTQVSKNRGTIQRVPKMSAANLGSNTERENSTKRLIFFLKIVYFRRSTVLSGLVWETFLVHIDD